MQFIIHQLMPKKEKKQLSKIFNVLDGNFDGRLTKEGMLKGFNSSFDDQATLTECVVDQIFAKVGKKVNGRDEIGFSDFILASVSHAECIVTNHHLNLAFQLFDKDGLGEIEAEGINSALGETLSDAELEQFKVEI